ncbi:MAG: universal stress protein [Oscillatoriaceae bacterium SKW80]|nr:universal stress protein [Oscillatoriaceae bacterium SKYG93]MCX8121183.1 universal stress protein [Oscillatoriaceae bacterium SKW80]MDW8453487.1 universal stress protein [Oscillatoriaceae cyanobacterium SKYGB_i_bin93]HIK26837.1 universal stress protein [Oscillatoriaceae cyanobacterium M7585_C2015_266]
MIEKILVAVAGRGLCEQMLKELMKIPSIQGAHVTVLHVVPNQVSSDAMSEKLQEGGKILAEAIKFLNLDPNKVTARLAQGDPKTTVCEVADEINADLIIMGSRGLGRLQAILENSVSQYVFQLTSRPMLLVKDDIYVKRLNRIMVAISSAPASQYALKLALFLLRDNKEGQLILTHINPADPEAKPEADPILAAAAAEAKKQGVSYRCITGKGKPGEEICRIADELNADLLLLGSPDRRPSIAKSLVDLDRLLGSSLSDYVRVHANCPVLLARSVE